MYIVANGGAFWLIATPHPCCVISSNNQPRRMFNISYFSFLILQSALPAQSKSIHIPSPKYLLPCYHAANPNSAHRLRHLREGRTPRKLFISPGTLQRHFLVSNSPQLRFQPASHPRHPHSPEARSCLLAQRIFYEIFALIDRDKRQ